MSTDNKAPLDVKILSILLFLAAFMFFEVNKNIFPFYGMIITGSVANILWIVTCLICLVCSFGIWKRKLLIWKLLIGYSFLYFGNTIINYFFIPIEKRIAITLEEVPKDFRYEDSIFYFAVILIFYALLIIYLFKRKNIFKE